MIMMKIIRQMCTCRFEATGLHICPAASSNENDVAIHGSDLYLLKSSLGPQMQFQDLSKAEKILITLLRIGHSLATKSHILSRWPPTTCHHCGQTLTIDHILLECAVLLESHNEYYTAGSMNTYWEILEIWTVQFLWGAISDIAQEH